MTFTEKGLVVWMWVFSLLAVGAIGAGIYYGFQPLLGLLQSWESLNTKAPWLNLAGVLLLLIILIIYGLAALTNPDMRRPRPWLVAVFLGTITGAVLETIHSPDAFLHKMGGVLYGLGYLICLGGIFLLPRKRSFFVAPAPHPKDHS